MPEVIQMSGKERPMTDRLKSNPKTRPSVTLPGTVERIIKPAQPGQPEKAQISIDGADDLYREIRIKNKLTSDRGSKVRLKNGEEVDVTVKADKKMTSTKKRG